MRRFAEKTPSERFAATDPPFCGRYLLPSSLLRPSVHHLRSRANCYQGRNYDVSPPSHDAPFRSVRPSPTRRSRTSASHCILAPWSTVSLQSAEHVFLAAIEKCPQSSRTARLVTSRAQQVSFIPRSLHTSFQVIRPGFSELLCRLVWPASQAIISCEAPAQPQPRRRLRTTR